MTLYLGSYQAPGPTLHLTNATVGDIDITDSTTPVPTGAYANIDVAGHTTFAGTISSTALFEDLTVRLAPHAVLTNHGTITTAGPEFGGHVDILGGKGSQLVNDGVIDPVHGGVAKADVDVSGTGVWEISNGGPASEQQNGSTLEFGRSVGAHQGVFFSGTAALITPETLLLDKPTAFHATVNGFNQASEYLELKGPVANAGWLQHGVIGDDLHLLNGKHEIADIHLGQHYDPGQFTVAYDKAGGGVSYVMFNAADTSQLIVAAGQPLHHF